MVLECFSTIHYECPLCGCRNAMRTILEHPRDGLKGTCKKCRKLWKFKELSKEIMKIHGWMEILKNPIHPKLTMLILEFDCDNCGVTNAIKPVKLNNVEKKNEKGYNVVVSTPIYSGGGESVTSGKCHSCGTEYDLKLTFPGCEI